MTDMNVPTCGDCIHADVCARVPYFTEFSRENPAYCKDFRKNQTWIPVAERLPEVGGCYLVALKYKYDFEKEYTYDTDVATFHFGYDRRYIDGQWNTCVDWDEGQQYLHVTHWMPLPEPPKEENNA